MIRRLIVAAIVLLALAVWYLAQDALSLQRLVEQEVELRARIVSAPWQAFALGFVVYTLVSLFPGTTGKSVVAGWLFGFWQAVPMVVVALTLAASTAFMVVRYVLHDAVRRLLGSRLRRFDEVLERDGVFFLLTLRLLHAPFTLVNYMSGVSDIGFPAFMWTTMVGLLPATMVTVGVGATLPSLGELLEHGVVGLLTPALVAGLGATALLPWGVRWLLRQRSSA